MSIEIEQLWAIRLKQDPPLYYSGGGPGVEARDASLYGSRAEAQDMLDRLRAQADELGLLAAFNANTRILPSPTITIRLDADAALEDLTSERVSFVVGGPITLEAISTELESILRELDWDTARGPAARLRALLAMLGGEAAPPELGPRHDLDCALLDQTYAPTTGDAEDYAVDRSRDRREGL